MYYPFTAERTRNVLLVSLFGPDYFLESVDVSAESDILTVVEEVGVVVLSKDAPNAVRVGALLDTLCVYLSAIAKANGVACQLFNSDLKFANTRVTS